MLITPATDSLRRVDQRDPVPVHHRAAGAGLRLHPRQLAAAYPAVSSIPGAAVTSIKIDGVLHEFTTIPGVKEDVVELVMNVKELCVSSEHDEPV